MVPDAPYWEVQRIVWTSSHQWEAFDGSLALTGVDPLALSPERFCNAFVTWLWQRHSNALRYATEAEQAEGQQQWDTWTAWVSSLPLDYADLLSPEEREELLPPEGWSEAEATAAAAYMRARSGG